MTEYVVYLRCSTGKQEISGLGIEAQREAVCRYAAQGNAAILAEFVEKQSGAKNDRAQLAKALATCRRSKATLLIARLDRLSRSLSFVAQLLDANVEIRCADMPEANRLLLQMLAVFSEHERQMIRDRTRAALAAAKARGVVLGSYGKQLAAHNRAAADQFARNLMQPIQDLLASGCIRLQDIADGLNDAGFVTREGGKWGPTAAHRVLRRLDLRTPAMTHAKAA